jgi:SAM-dependent methyltransferase
MSVILDLSKILINRYIDQNSVVIDATCGNGYDTNYLAQIVREVYSFDIQEIAIVNSKEKNKILNNIFYFNEGHENIDKNVKTAIDLSLFNLGYLPNSDKSITTKFSTTKEGIEQSFKLLKPKKAIIIIVYHGHNEGKVEADLLSEYLLNVDKNLADIFVHKLINKPNTPPYIYEIVKR